MYFKVNTHEIMTVFPQVEVNTDYIPVGLEESYSRERAGKTLETLVPVGKAPDQFADNLGVKFKSVSV